MQSRIRSTSLWLVAAGAVMAAIVAVKAATAPDTSILGSYKVLVRGDYTGDGNAAVGAKSVTINAKLTDSGGNVVHLVAANLQLENGRFNGTGRLGGVDVRVSGRVDPPGSMLKAARLTATFGNATAPSGRVVGDRRGS